MDRPDDPVIPPGTPWLEDPAVQAVCKAIAAGGGAVYFVGGCVRDALLGLESDDVDLATDAPPADVTRMVEAAGLKAVPTGIDHGTVTVVSDGRGLEVTTFRRDVATDGRRASVAFSKDIREDARRRDFTLNALYARPDGQVLDPLGQGIADCHARRIRFIDDPDKRIREDYLRILRFFRFHAWYAPADTGMSADALDAIARNYDGLETLSAERVGAEMMRMLAAPDPAPAVAALARTGALARILPAADPAPLAPFVHLEAFLGLSPDALGRLAAIGGEDAPDRFRLSRKDARVYHAVRSALQSDMPLPEIAYREGARIASATALTRAAIMGTTISQGLPAQLKWASSRVFPIKASDLMPDYEGAALGDRLRDLEARWIASGFMLTRAELLDAE